MQFKVPQDVLRPDKIVGFLTLRQLVIVLIGGSLDYCLYLILNKQYYVQIWLIPVIFIALITMAFAFIRFNEIVFEKLVFVFISYKFLPQHRIWQKMKGDAVRSVLDVIQQSSAKKTEVKQTAEDRRKKLEEITKLVDSHSSELLTKKSVQELSNSTNKTK